MYSGTERLRIDRFLGTIFNYLSTLMSPTLKRPSENFPAGCYLRSEKKIRITLFSEEICVPKDGRIRKIKKLMKKDARSTILYMEVSKWIIQNILNHKVGTCTGRPERYSLSSHSTDFFNFGNIKELVTNNYWEYFFPFLLINHHFCDTSWRMVLGWKNYSLRLS